MSERASGARTFVGSGARLNDLMFRAGLSRSELASRADISRDTLHTALNDQMTAKTAAKLANALGVELEYLLHGTGSGPAVWERNAEYNASPSLQGEQIEEWFSNLDRIVLTLRNFPGGEIGQKLKIGFLNAVEDIARDTGNKLPIEYYRIRKEVQDGER